MSIALHSDPFTAQCGDSIASRESFGITVVERHNIVDGRAEEIVATADGRRAEVSRWHRGPESEWIYFERIHADGSGSHGFVDSASRKIVQVG